MLLRFEGAGADTDREQVSALCGEWGTVDFVDYSRGDASGTVRSPRCGDLPVQLYPLYPAIRLCA